MMDFFAMGGYAFYVWGSYGMTALVVIVEVAALIGRRRSALEEARLSGPEDARIAATSRGAA
jgi:heme exporter protein D